MALAALIERARAARIEDEIARRGIRLRRIGAELIGPCPLCGGEDRFGINLRKQAFNCRGCGGRGRDAISLVRFLDGVDFVTACAVLGGGHGSAPRSPPLPTPGKRVARSATGGGRWPRRWPAPGAHGEQQSRRRAAALWREAIPIEGTAAERYLRGRGLNIPAGVSGRVLRFHPRCPFLDHEAAGAARIAVPAMLALFRRIAGDEPAAIHRTALTADGRKANLAKPKQSLASTSDAAIKLTADADVTHGLTIAEGIETALAGMALGFSPAWVVGLSGMRKFPVLAGVECLTILVDNDPADAFGRRAGPDAAAACSQRWTAAGCEVRRVVPHAAGVDLADLSEP